MSKTTGEARRLVVTLDGHGCLPREILGNKGYGIDAMRRQGLPVPPAFCITTDVCAQFFANPESCLDEIWKDVRDKIGWLEAETSRTFGRGPRPLLVSVRSGAAQSMPGMMDTVLDLGIDDAVEAALASAGSAEFSRDTRNRFTDMYRRIVLGGTPASKFPTDPWAQLRGAIEAVRVVEEPPRDQLPSPSRLWRTSRARGHRAGHGVRQSGAGDSGTGVLFSPYPIHRNPTKPFGEWLDERPG